MYLALIEHKLSRIPTGERLTSSLFTQRGRGVELGIASIAQSMVRTIWLHVLTFSKSEDMNPSSSDHIIFPSTSYNLSCILFQ